MANLQPSQLQPPFRLIACPWCPAKARLENHFSIFEDRMLYRIMCYSCGKTVSCDAEGKFEEKK